MKDRDYIAAAIDGTYSTKMLMALDQRDWSDEAKILAKALSEMEIWSAEEIYQKTKSHAALYLYLDILQVKDWDDLIDRVK